VVVRIGKHASMTLPLRTNKQKAGLRKKCLRISFGGPAVFSSKTRCFPSSPHEEFGFIGDSIRVLIKQRLRVSRTFMGSKVFFNRNRLCGGVFLGYAEYFIILLFMLFKAISSEGVKISQE